MKTLALHADAIGRGSLILVNSTHPMRCEPASEDLIAVRPDFPHIFLDRRAADMLAQVTAALNCGQQIVPVSGYRTMQEQQTIYADSLRENGREFTEKYVAVPGCSEHQAGLAIDLGENKPNVDFIRPDFPYTGICQAFRELSVKYGFIERYPAGREHVTGIAHEPWHFRYVGYPHSELMQEQNLTLEEYTDYLKRFPYSGEHLRFRSGKWNYELFHVPVLPNEVVHVDIPDKTPFQVSGNNEDGFVVTLWGNPL